MASLDNIPRKEKQFVNFASNSLQLRGYNKKIVDEIWICLRQEREKRIAEREKLQLAEKEKREQEEKEVSDAKSEEKDHEKISNNDHDQKIDAKKVKKITKKTLKKAPNRSMRIKDLRRVLGKELGLPESAKKCLKMVLLETANTSKDKIKIDGKIICLN